MKIVLLYSYTWCENDAPTTNYSIESTARLVIFAGTNFRETEKKDAFLNFAA